ncbi:intracellular serine protease [Fusarium albosuccineum]|uniref:Intracellular serine protease n=1 Tax=Fusarium albosuccineum TaxID=1237068 RepID=A0A8H4P9H6_9HYPO|nr:intracellular serine protease [Fusarium albosuccineum]
MEFKEKETLDEVLRRPRKQKKRFIRIGNAHDDGSTYLRAGTDNEFVFPGANVNTSYGRSLTLSLVDMTSLAKDSTGSRIATALAVDLAA